jgi:hypothetical protein
MSWLDPAGLAFSGCIPAQERPTARCGGFLDERTVLLLEG